jgi:hypothetical protein
VRAVERLPPEPGDAAGNKRPRATAVAAHKADGSIAEWYGGSAMSRRGYGSMPLAGLSTAGLDAHFDAGQDDS